MSEGPQFDWRRPVTLSGYKGVAVWAVIFVVGLIIVGSERRSFFVLFVALYWGCFVILRLSERPWRWPKRR
jgi:hypothetical protein